MDERKVSRFQIGDEVTTHLAIRNWAGFQSGELRTYTIMTIEERVDRDDRSDTEFWYQTSAGPVTAESELVPADDAQRLAISFLAGRLKAIAAWQKKVEA